MQVVPIVVSCHSCVDFIVVVAASARRPGVDVLSWGELIVIWGALLSLKDWAISVNLGSHAGFLSMGLSRGAETCAKIVHKPGVVGVEVVIVVTVKGTARGLEHPTNGVVRKEPRGWALCILLQSHAFMATWASSSTILELLEDVIFFQGEGDHWQGHLHL